jgi:hypothetical protein
LGASVVEVDLPHPTRLANIIPARSHTTTFFTKSIPSV